jgi:hypothetical protein
MVYRHCWRERMEHQILKDRLTRQHETILVEDPAALDHGRAAASRGDDDGAARIQTAGDARMRTAVGQEEEERVGAREPLGHACDVPMKIAGLCRARMAQNVLRGHPRLWHGGRQSRVDRPAAAHYHPKTRQGRAPRCLEILYAFWSILNPASCAAPVGARGQLREKSEQRERHHR